eukprot:Skav212792  [mRNA]  locus=scaffold159:497156:505797:- [translate_table: standard]
MFTGRAVNVLTTSDPGADADVHPKRLGESVLAFFKHVWLSGLREEWLVDGKVDEMALKRDQHLAWLKKGLMSLPPNFCGLDASRPWFVYWISHAMEVLGDFDEQHWSPQLASFLAHCQDPTGGFAGGPSQLPHLAPTYAAVSALMVAGTPEAYRVVDRAAMYGFLMRMKSSEGGFKMHDEGETDMRGCYCAIAVASMLHILTDELLNGVPEYVARCQTWEGGIAGEEGLEAHGGYSYCGLAALCIAGRADALDLHSFLRWAVNKQMSHEGGFQATAFRQSQQIELPEDHCWFKPEPLQMYILLACQHPNGGLRDKPTKSADFYHTCYALSGMAVSQIVCATFPFMACTGHCFAKQLERQMTEQTADFAKASTVAEELWMGTSSRHGTCSVVAPEESLMGIRTVSAFGTETFQQNCFEKQLGAARSGGIRSGIRNLGG